MGKDYVCYYQKWPHSTQVPFDDSFLRFYNHDDYIKLFKLTQSNNKLEYTPVKFSPPDSFHPRHARSFYVEIYEPFLIIVAGTAEHIRLMPHPENGDRQNHRGDPNVDSSSEDDEMPRRPNRRPRLKNSLFIIYLKNQKISKRLQLSGNWKFKKYPSLILTQNFDKIKFPIKRS